MSRTRAEVVLPLLAFFVLSPTRGVVAAPPDERSSALKLDKVADGLRRYQQQKSDAKRVEWLKRLAPSKDPRVFETLKSALSDSSKAVAWVAFELLGEPYGGPRPSRPPPPRPSGPPET
jgi:hypothetical protein